MQASGKSPDFAAIIAALRDDWQSYADANKAAAMQAYMKHHFNFLGIATPQRRNLSKPYIADSKYYNVTQLLQFAELLWQTPEREFHYLAIDLLAANQRRLSIKELPGLLTLLQTNSWWDSVDGLISVIDKIALRSPAAEVESLMDACLVHPDFWLRRLAMLHQKSWKQATNQARLFRYALKLAPESEFFIRKAIGWALREYAKTAPQAVESFLHQHGAELSPLSRREAGKHL